MQSSPTSPSNPGWARGLGSRWIGAARLRGSAFAEVQSDARGLRQALLVVLAGGIGRGLGVAPEEGWLGMIGSPAVGLVVWMVAAVLVWGIAAEVLVRAPEFSPLLRTLGFAAAPLVGLAICAALPAPAARVWWGLVHAWATLAFAVAVREGLGVSALRALVVCLVSLGIALVLLLLAAAVLIDAAYLD
jgi:hypothetical protein